MNQPSQAVPHLTTPTRKELPAPPKVHSSTNLFPLFARLFLSFVGKVLSELAAFASACNIGASPRNGLSPH